MLRSFYELIIVQQSLFPGILLPSELCEVLFYVLEPNFPTGNLSNFKLRVLVVQKKLHEQAHNFFVCEYLMPFQPTRVGVTMDVWV